MGTNVPKVSGYRSWLKPQPTTKVNCIREVRLLGFGASNAPAMMYRFAIRLAVRPPKLGRGF
jgi:hypothetical protein